MSSSEAYRERYAAVSNARLLEILSKPEDYAPEAVQAAHQELDSRKLSDSERQEANEHLEAQERRHTTGLTPKQAEVKVAVTSRVKRFFENINPIDKKAPGEERVFRVLLTGISLVVLFGLVDFVRDLYWVFQSSFMSVKHVVVSHLFTLVLMAGWLLLLFRKREGWALSTAAFLSSTIVLVGLNVVHLSQQRDSQAPSGHTTYEVYQELASAELTRHEMDYIHRCRQLTAGLEEMGEGEDMRWTELLTEKRRAEIDALGYETEAYVKEESPDLLDMEVGEMGYEEPSPFDLIVRMGLTVLFYIGFLIGLLLPALRRRFGINRNAIGAMLVLTLVIVIVQASVVIF